MLFRIQGTKTRWRGVVSCVVECVISNIVGCIIRYVMECVIG